MKHAIIIALFCASVVGLAAIIKQERTIVEEVTVSHNHPRQNVVSVKVTLTKYQLKKMLGLIEEKHSHLDPQKGVAPADHQDSMTFKASARGMGGVYEISSTQLATYTGKVRVEPKE